MQPFAGTQMRKPYCQIVAPYRAITLRTSQNWQDSQKRLILKTRLAVKQELSVAPDKEELYRAVGAAAVYSVATIATTSPGRRGLVSTKEIVEGDVVFHVPWHNVLSVPTSNKGLKFWRERYLDPFQQIHGKLPAQLLDFLQGPLRPFL
jgi:hypothetical protein